MLGKGGSFDPTMVCPLLIDRVGVAASSNKGVRGTRVGKCFGDAVWSSLGGVADAYGGGCGGLMVWRAIFENEDCAEEDVGWGVDAAKGLNLPQKWLGRPEC